MRDLSTNYVVMEFVAIHCNYSLGARAGARARARSLCTHMGRARKKQPCFEEN